MAWCLPARATTRVRPYKLRRYIGANLPALPGRWLDDVTAWLRTYYRTVATSGGTTMKQKPDKIDRMAR